MKGTKAALAGLLAFTASPASGAEWVPVGVDDLGVRWYFDATSMRRHGDAINVWVRRDAAGIAAVPWRTMDSLARVWCRSRRYAVKSYFRAFANGRRESSNWENEPDDPITVRPGSMPEAVWEGVCAAVGEMPNDGR